MVVILGKAPLYRFTKAEEPSMSRAMTMKVKSALPITASALTTIGSVCRAATKRSWVSGRSRSITGCR